MRRKLIRTALIIGLLIALMTPLAAGLSRIQGDIEQNDAKHVVEPMLRLYAQNPASCADIPVDAVMDIESVWEIEDTRSEAQEPLVVSMRNGGDVLGYDEESSTFYCSIGLDFQEEAWPEIELYVQAKDESVPLKASFVDDYSYDYPSESVHDGYRYELLAYTDDEYQYFGIVYTGLPIVTLHAETEIGEEYVPAFVSVSSAQHEPVASMAQAHERGGGYVLRTGKYSYRIEFQEITQTGRSKAHDISLLGMEPDSDWLLIANAKDSRCVLNHLAFNMWNNWIEEEHAFMKLETRMVEVFLDNEYKGLFQLMQRHDTQKEIVDSGGSLATDYCVRLVSPFNTGDLPIRGVSNKRSIHVECRYAPANQYDRAFELFENYSRMSEWLDEERISDEEFIRISQECMDVESFVSYFLFHLMVGLTDDNIANNVFYYILNEDGKMLMHPAPWDMDWAFFYGYFNEEPTSEKRFDFGTIPVVRMLDLNVMNSRQTLHDMYRELRETVISEEAVTRWIKTTEQEIDASGAYLRDSEKWRGEASAFSLEDMLNYEIVQAEIIGDLIERRWPLEPAQQE